MGATHVETALVLVLLVVVLGLNVWGTGKVLSDSLSTNTQRIGQGLIVWLLPIVGAMIVLYVHRDSVEQPPREPEYRSSDQWENSPNIRSAAGRRRSEEAEDAD